jgi:UTP-glucose-1-phosphate uridylyltransferase
LNLPNKEMQKPVVLILAAGLGARFGGYKQVKGIGPNEEIIMDYSIVDALAVGFEKIIIVIQENMLADLRKRYCEDLNLPIDFRIQPKELVHKNQKVSREKPWGTGHAVLAAKQSISQPFCIINADDFYGRNSFQLAYDCLSTKRNCAIVFPLKSTLSENGYVNRAEIITEDGVLKSTIEREQIVLKGNQVFYASTSKETLDGDTNVSMNMWGFTPDIFTYLAGELEVFLNHWEKNKEMEFQLPTAINAIIAKFSLEIAVIPSTESWFGLTYQEDMLNTKEKILLKNYPSPLWKK